MLTKAQFDILYCVWKAGDEKLSQRGISSSSGISLGKVNHEMTELRSAGLIDDACKLTDHGLRALSPYRVKNAVIMAAGMSTRFAPLSYEKPKALLKVKGDILIEREIRQLQEAGITDITLVVGYMKEKMFYLAEKYGVDIVINEDYYRYNNTSTLIRVLDRLDNTYICSSDDYFSENVFEPYVYRPYYAAVYTPDKTDEYCLTTDRKGRITKVTIGGEASWYMLGHVYFDRAFSQKFGQILLEEYDKPSTREELWENLYMKHIRELELFIRKYPSDVIHEFDSLDELRGFDSHYIVNSDSMIFRNIESVLGCKDSDITQIEPIKNGLTNTSFAFTCKDRRYVYRHPGVGTSAYIERKSEALSMEIARRLGLDDTFIYIDPENGWKLSYYIEDARTLDYHNPKEVSMALDMVRRLHESKETSPYRFDLFEEIEKFERRLKESSRGDFADREELSQLFRQLKDCVAADNVPECISHNDCYDPNFLLDRDGKMYLIDWEYSGMADPASDIGTFIACSDYTMEEVDALLAEYLGHAPEVDDYRHYIAYAGISSYYWFVWALYQESVGKSVGEYLYLWYRYAKLYGRKALELYQGR